MILSAVIYICTAVNSFGDLYQVYDTDKKSAQERAIKMCEKDGGPCYQTGCRIPALEGE